MTPQRKTSNGKRRRRRQDKIPKKFKLATPETPRARPASSDATGNVGPPAEGAFAALDAATPPAPARRTRACIDVLRVLTRPSLDLCDAHCRKCIKCCLAHEALAGELYVEWPDWDINTWALTEARSQWLKLELVAARFARLELINFLIEKDFWNARTTNELGQTPLISLCAQPPAEVLIFEQRRLQPAILRVNNLSALDDVGENSAEALREMLDLASEREREMATIAARLLALGADPRECDDRGYCAADYAKAFRHDAVARVLEGLGPEEKPSQSTVKRDGGIAPQCTVETEIPNDEDFEVHTPRSKELVSDDFTDSPFMQTCASNVPTACELASNGKRTKRYNKMLLSRPPAVDDELLV